MGSGPLSVDVYVAPMRPYTCPDRLGEGEVATWAPSSSTLISGPTEGILIDALLTFDNANQIAAWAKSFGKKITGVYITHGHSDHWLGLARLLQHFPEARGYAAPEVAARAAWEVEFNRKSKYWTSRFPSELPETPVVPEVLNTDEILVDSQVVNLIHAGQGDIEGSTIFHVPSADAVVCGDVWSVGTNGRGMLILRVRRRRWQLNEQRRLNGARYEENAFQNSRTFPNLPWS